MTSPETPRRPHEITLVVVTEPADENLWQGPWRCRDEVDRPGRLRSRLVRTGLRHRVRRRHPLYQPILATWWRSAPA